MGRAMARPTDRRRFGPLIPKTLSAVVNAYKSTVTRISKKANYLLEEKFWQVNYYEHIIRNESELLAFRRYIQNNPMNHWLKKIKTVGAV